MKQKTFDVIQFLTDFSIPYSDQGKNAQPGWVQIECPFCDDYSNHGGFNIKEGYYNCWLCGSHSMYSYTTDSGRKITGVFEMLTGTELTRDLKRKYLGYTQISESKEQYHATTCFLPPHTDLQSRHKKYLINRNFNPIQLVKDWGLVAATSIGDYKFRILAPIYLDNTLISYQGRDVTDKSDLRYKACAMVDEVLHHKKSLYGIDFIKNKSAIIVEGITDCWRLGHGAIATFGTGYKDEQVAMLVDRLDKAYILFDIGASDKAEELANKLSLLGMGLVEVYELDKGDPGELTEYQAKSIVGKLLK